MRKRWKPLLSLILIVWVVFAGFTLIEFGGKYIGKSYFESEEFGYGIDEFMQNIGPMLLNPIDPEELKSKLTVSQEEIEEHRTRYGTLSDQIANLRLQYEDRIAEAKANNAEDLLKTLTDERDTKIADITKNFESDEHIKTKILAEKEKLVDEYMQRIKSQKTLMLSNYSYISFKLTDIESGKTFTIGNVNESAVYKQKFTSASPFITSSIEENISNSIWSDNYGFGEVVMEPTMSYSDGSSIVNLEHRYTGILTISKAAWLTNYNNVEAYDHFKRNQIIYISIWLSSLIAIILLFTKFKPKLADYLVENPIKAKLWSWPIDVQVVLVMVTFGLFLVCLTLAYEQIENNYNTFRTIWDLVFSFAILFIVGILLLLQFVWIYDRVRTWDRFVEAVQQSWLWRMGEFIKDLFLNRSIGVQSLILIVAAFLGGMGLVGSAMGNGTFVILSIICFVVGIPAVVVFLSRMGYMNRIMKNTSLMAEGRLKTEIKVKGKSPFAQHAQNLNELREGVAQSMNEQAKSERLKTELITNVSHDLRTPLTSIITYTDLLKNPDITEEERNQYIAVLDKKSERLKTLIEDLFEVSKMASGNIELHKQRVDLSQLVKQAVGEHEEDLQKARLDLRMSIPDTVLHAYVDGQKWWRVVDNLIINVLKYSLEGTRVYVTLKRNANNEAELVIKNVAKYELNDNVEELFERFKRADTSRHTDGSGLGLAIAQSIVDLHGGRMNLEVDGDLFKVTVIVVAV